MERDLIFDVGMHKGEDTAYYLMKGYRVVGFEANADLVKHCKLRFRDAIDTGRLKIVHGAISPHNKYEEVKFYRSESSLFGTTNSVWAHRNSMFSIGFDVINISCINIDDFYAKFGVPFYMKIDIEGSDLCVLESLSTLAIKPHFVSIESEKVEFSKLKAEIEMFVQLGYSRFKAVQQGAIPGSEVVSHTLDGIEFRYRFEQDSSGPFGDDIGQPWLTASDVVEQYKEIFRMYKMFGDYSSFRRITKNVRSIIGQVYKLSSGYKGPLPGWYDTHAAL